MKLPFLQQNPSLDAFYDPEAFSVYVHVPFCVRRCRYCAFVSSVYRELPEAAFVRAIGREIEASPSLGRHRRFRSLYFGGGTPSLLSPEGLEQMMSALFEHFGRPEELTLEANPEHCSLAHLRAWRRLGVTRLSLGSQSFQPEILKFLGRAHGPEELCEAILFAREAGFDELSLDLIYGSRLPSSSEDALALWRSDLERAASFSPEHLSCYELTLEEGTALARANRRKAVRLDEGLLLEMMAMVPRHSALVPYELSNYSTRAYYSAHNLACWAGEAYWAFGPGAHGLYIRDGRYRRYSVSRDVRAYLGGRSSGPGHYEMIEEVPPALHLAERLICALRTRFFWSIERMAEELQTGWRHFELVLSKAEAYGWLEREGGLCRTTEAGISLNNRLLELIFSAVGDEEARPLTELV